MPFVSLPSASVKNISMQWWSRSVSVMTDFFCIGCDVLGVGHLAGHRPHLARCVHVARLVLHCRRGSVDPEPLVLAGDVVVAPVAAALELGEGAGRVRVTLVPLLQEPPAQLHRVRHHARRDHRLAGSHPELHDGLEGSHERLEPLMMLVGTGHGHAPIGFRLRLLLLCHRLAPLTNGDTSVSPAARRGGSQTGRPTCSPRRPRVPPDTHVFQGCRRQHAVRIPRPAVNPCEAFRPFIEWPWNGTPDFTA